LVNAVREQADAFAARRVPQCRPRVHRFLQFIARTRLRQVAEDFPSLIDGIASDRYRQQDPHCIGASFDLLNTDASHARHPLV
jgi:hypothetical protein